MGILTEADAAQTELAVKTARTAAELAPVMRAHLELRLAFRLFD